MGQSGGAGASIHPHAGVPPWAAGRYGSQRSTCQTSAVGKNSNAGPREVSPSKPGSDGDGHQALQELSADVRHMLETEGSAYRALIPYAFA